MSYDQVKTQLAMISLNRLNGVLEHYGLLTQGIKGDAMISVYDSIIKPGLMTIDEIKTGNHYAPHATPPADDLSAKIGDINTSILNTKTSLQILEARLDKVSMDVRSEVAQAGNQIERVVSRLDGLEAKSFSTEIHAAVSQAFDAFKQHVEPERLQEIAETLPTFRIGQACDVFPDTEYVDGEKVIDFGDLTVLLWDDPNAPEIVDDYVFDPAHLHQALIALDDPLPDNVWLAGERGTGKTEFVTQIAARLGRRLFRVNFDEAIERADFIGSNTIKDGNVVWQAGVIAQAIQHPGALVLLDEVGFARAQSIAVLHSVCERSPNRSIVVPETGERIKVAAYVSFFAADNSNGHGDASGNFAGVRDQNTAFLDRFGFTLSFQYLPANKESLLIQKRTGVDSIVADQLVDFAKVAREKASAGLLTQPPSLRQLFAWARALNRKMPVRKSFENAILNKYPEDCHAELLGVYSAVIIESLY